ncbi:hypothetical protein EYF80_017453 [Liparis tanakae]|uniref:Uncharacterized protein n=1 Tax=Liparis tanakae TaxID=230148 RepID=A0A4Z2I3G4_9TELE|nr:hypothetical protein EYF80_017453 [Liparis tanakae]
MRSSSDKTIPAPNSVPLMLELAVPVNCFQHPSGADKVQLASLARLILLRDRHRGHHDDKVHLWEVGIGVKSGNCCPIPSQIGTYSVSQEGSWCHKKSIKSTTMKYNFVVRDQKGSAVYLKRSQPAVVSNGGEVWWL